MFLLSSTREVKKLLDVAFADIGANVFNSGFLPTYFSHNHIYTLKRSTCNLTVPDENVRILFELHDPKTVPLHNVFNLYRKCPLGKVLNPSTHQPTGRLRTGELPQSLIRVDDVRDYAGTIRSGRVLDFTVTISTNLKILLIGDSVMVQLGQAFDEIVGGNLHTRRVLWEAIKGNEDHEDGGTVVAPTRGGGVSAMWRMTGLLSKSQKGKPPANNKGGGWSDNDINAYLSYSYPSLIIDDQDGQQKQQQQNSTIIGNFDVVIFRVMHGWMALHEITHERLVEAVELSHELLGTTTVVSLTDCFIHEQCRREKCTQLQTYYIS